MKRIYFMRHGETDLNRQQRMQGQSDFPLNQQGREQAARAGQQFRRWGLQFDRVISSPLSRARETAALATGQEITDIPTDMRLIEMGYGPYESLTFGELGSDAFRFLYDPEHIPAPEGMEPIPAVVARTGDFLRELAADERDETVLVVSHGVAMRAMVRNLSGSEAAWRLPIENCVLYRSEIVDGEYSPVTKVERDD